MGVVIPLFDSAGSLQRAVRSLTEQTHEDWLAVIVDDGSTDHGLALAQSLSRAEPRLRVVSQPNAGVASARNRGLDHLAGENVHFVTFLDADDEFTPWAFERLLAAAARESSLAAFGDFQFVNARGVPLGEQRARASLVGLNELLGSVFLLVSSVLIDARILRAERFRTDLHLIEDTDLWLRLAHQGVSFAHASDIVTRYTIHAAARSQAFREMARATAQVYADAYARSRQIPIDRSEGIDCSEPRLAAVLARSNWNYATRAALVGPDALAAFDRACAIVDPSAMRRPLAPDQPCLDASTLVRSGMRAVIMALGIDPLDFGSRSLWAPRLRQWWAFAARAGVIDHVVAEAAAATFHDHDPVATTAPAAPVRSVA